MDTYPILRPGASLCGRDDHFGNHVQTIGHFKHRHCPLHRLALSPLGYQTLLESFCRYYKDKKMVDSHHAVDNSFCPCGIAFTIPTPFFFQLTLAIFWLVGFTSATHDIAADGFYMLALSEHEQSLYVGIRSTFYRVATVAGQGLLVIVAA